MLECNDISEIEGLRSFRNLKYLRFYKTNIPESTIKKLPSSDVNNDYYAFAQNGVKICRNNSS